MNKILKDRGLLFFGFIMTISLELLITKSLYLSISMKNQILLSLTIWLITILIVYFYPLIKKWMMILYIIPIYLLFSLLPFQTIAKIFSHRPYIYESLNKIIILIKGDKAKDFMIWAFKYSFGFENTKPLEFQIIIIAIIFFSISSYYSMLIIRKNKMIYILVPVLLYYFQWIRYIDNVFILLNIYIIGLFGLWICKEYLERTKVIHKNQWGYKFYNYKGIIIFSTLIITILVLASNMFIKAFYESKLNDKMSELFPAIMSLRTEPTQENTLHNYFGVKLGGTIEEDDTLIMKVKSERPSVYLRGRVKNIYDGSSWYSNNNDFVRLNKDKIINKEILEIPNSSSTTKITIYPEKEEISTIFAPYIPLEINMNSSQVHCNEDMEMFYKKGIVNIRKPSYEVISIIPSVDSEEGTSNIIDKRIIEKESYLKLPEALPERVLTLSRAITENHETQYDKMKALEVYLRDNYRYTLTVDDIPVGKDFVDYFLFESKEGYCTYYATSLAIMGRAIDIPTRYVEGFLLPDSPTKDNIYEVTGERAHAWVEAYIDDVGWITLEPTSSYGVITSDKEEKQTQEAQVIKDTRENSSYDELKLRLEEERNAVNQGDYTYVPQSKNYNIYIWVSFSILSIIIIRSFYILVKNKRSFEEMNSREIIIKYYHMIRYLYSYIDHKDQTIHSPKELLIIISKNLLAKDVNDDIIDIVNRSLYSKENMNDEDLEKIKTFTEYIDKASIKRIGRFNYYYHKYFIGDIYKIY